MVNKILKKIIGVLGYKLVDKNLIKNNRLIESKSKINLNFILNKIFNNHEINCLVQIGANDGKRFDEISRFIKDHKIKSILVEPIEEYFEELKKNYQNFDNVKFENSAISVGNQEKEIFLVSKENLKNYDEHVSGLNSFDKKHLLKHGVKSKHIDRKKINCISIVDLLEKYSISNLDLLFVDAEGYDADILVDFLKNTNQEPIIIFEYVHVNNNLLENLVGLLLSKKYSYFNINENLICFPNKMKEFL